MTISIIHDPLQTVMGRNPSTDFYFTATPELVTHPPFTGQRIFEDADVYQTYAGGSEIKIAFNVVGEYDSIDIVTPDTCRFNEGKIEQIPYSWGDVIVDVKSKGTTRRFSFSYDFGSPPRFVLNDYVEGSLAHHIHRSIAALVEGKSNVGYANKLLFNVEDYATATYVRNPNLFTGNLDISAMSASTGNCNLSCCLLTPQHCAAAHCGVSFGQDLHWLGSDNVVYTRRAIDILNVDSTDFVCLLNEPLPPTVKPMMMFPEDWRDYLPKSYVPGVRGYFYLPYINRKQNTNRSLRILMATDHLSFGYKQPGLEPDEITPTDIPVEYPFYGWSEKVLGGDSNGTAFYVVNNNPVYLGAMTMGGGTNYNLCIPLVNSLIDQLGRNGHSLTHVDLSGFTKYLNSTPYVV